MSGHHSASLASSWGCHTTWQYQASNLRIFLKTLPGDSYSNDFLNWYIYICVILNIYVFITTPPLRVVVICRSECPCHMFHMFSHFSPSWKGSKRFKSPWSSKKTLAAAALRSDESRGKIIRFKFHQSISRSMQYAIANVFGEKNMWSLLMSHLSFLFQICFMFNLCAEILPYYTSLTWHSNV